MTAAGLAWLLLIAAAPVRAQDDSLAYAVKATYLYKLTAFVRWPAHAFESDASAMRLCVVGDDPFGNLLPRAVQGQSVAGRSFAVTRLGVVEDGPGCHVMFLAGSARQSVAEALARVRGQPILTVTDADTGSAGGIVHFVERDQRVRFAIDDQAAAENGLEISARLLDLAVHVRRRGQ